jgi:type I restriction enzyme S subunit
MERASSLKTEVKYKDTPIGKIPVDWEVKKLADVASSERYGFAGGPFGSDLKEESYTKEGVRVIQLQNIGDGKFVDDYKIFTSEQKADELKKCNIYPGDIIIAKMADPIARASIIPATDKRYLMASDGIRLSVDKEEYDTKFILYAINSRYFRRSAEKNSTGTTRLRIGLGELKNLLVAVPTILEQRKIAEILTTVDKAIEKTTEIIEKEREVKKGLMQTLLTRGIGHKKFKKTEIGEIPEEWRVGKLSDLVQITMGQSPPGNTYNRVGTGSPILNGPTEFTDYFPVPVQFTTQPIKTCKTRDILLCVRGSSTGRMNIADREYCIGRGLAAIRNKANSDLAYLYYKLQDLTPKIFAEASGSGSTFPNISGAALEKMQIPMPPFEEQKNISKILSSMDDEIKEESGYKQQLEIVKKGLMQFLLTGKVRVSV